MAVDFKDLETRLVSAPVRLRRRSARAKAPVLAPSRVVDLTAATVVLPVAPVVLPVAAPLSPAGDASYWVRRRRAEAQASDPS